MSKNCARDCYNKFFHSFKIRRIYNIEMTNGDLVNGVISDKKLKKLPEKVVSYIN